ncbi:helix-turn-helix domain-containing protein [Bradyrhizobium sp. 40]|uniref:helix-turn-helix domain-containing protein n=1 Tax=Bradyrhizobium sp. 40 TaxID=2782674 RepID=UPI001FFFC2B1|nr:helix-turn-helix domain-containing protein [Bradyrhizobium sp. 40]UPJ41952.1 helix-turn-helix domain-containing protein [Bradyrhizobium sp. 40]
MSGTPDSASGAIMSSPKRPAPQIFNVQAIRAASGIGQTQQTFADAIGVPVKTLRNWEQGRRRPTGPALVLLRLIHLNPKTVIGILERK